jgi:flagellar basal body-associated protein FliL
VIMMIVLKYKTMIVLMVVIMVVIMVVMMMIMMMLGKDNNDCL